MVTSLSICSWNEAVRGSFSSLKRVSGHHGNRIVECQHKEQNYLATHWREDTLATFWSPSWLGSPQLSIQLAKAPLNKFYCVLLFFCKHLHIKCPVQINVPCWYDCACRWQLQPQALTHGPLLTVFIHLCLRGPGSYSSVWGAIMLATWWQSLSVCLPSTLWEPSCVGQDRMNRQKRLLTGFPL